MTIVGERQRDELLDQRLRARDGDRAHGPHSRHDRERALKLRLRFERAAAVERTDTRGLSRGGGVHLGRSDADALERPHEHPVMRQRPHGREDVVALSCLGRGEHALAE